MSDENRIRLIASQPIRGRILDKNGLILADSKYKYSLIIKPQYVSNSDWIRYKEKLSILLDLEKDLLHKRYFEGLSKKYFSFEVLESEEFPELYNI